MRRVHTSCSLFASGGWLHSYDSYVSFIQPTWAPQLTWPGSDAGFTTLQLRYNCNFGLIITIGNKPCKHDQYMFQISSKNWEPNSNLLKLWEISAMAWIMYWKHWSYHLDTERGHLGDLIRKSVKLRQTIVSSLVPMKVIPDPIWFLLRLLLFCVIEHQMTTELHKSSISLCPSRAEKCDMNGGSQTLSKN
jgi:hypothetical protein